ncbi:hypothetical protein [Kocuria rosea]|uniref:Uncharacterized protein n=1 Tax=Kocuria rosea TaxID=1275 RepID=A0A4R5YCT5_KOCRO|nr:hypothetical protein [Kocuria rosea]TDL42840.1 hypothetical protein E2R59_08385 [Kocuria rosea]
MGQHEPVRPGARSVRRWLAGFLSTIAAGASRYAAEGSTPDLVLLLMAVAAAGLVCVLLAGARMGPVRVGMAVALSQGVHHALYSVPALAPCTATGVTEHAPHGAATIRTTASFEVTSCLVPAVSGHSPMLAAHLLAAVTTFLLLRHGERSWWGLVDALGTRLPQVLPLVLPLIPAARPDRRAGEFFHHALRDLALARAVVSRRGPPAPVA